MSQIYLFDGSLEGLLTAVFEWFERKPGEVVLLPAAIHQPDVFNPAFDVITDRTKADRVWKGLQKRLDQKWLRKLYCCYLSEQSDALNSIFQFACYLFGNDANVEKNYGNVHVLAVSQMATKVEREKHRMEAFIRFQHTTDGIFYCGIDPDFNVIPLIVNHFKNRYADQKWIIFDLKRHYGVHYDLQNVAEITMELELGKLKQDQSSPFSDEEARYADLWKNYFKSTNIESRKNTKLHVQHVPKRYWKYLTEKQ